MSDQQQGHQLNGYKFSFNRVNPYYDKVIENNYTFTGNDQKKAENFILHKDLVQTGASMEKPITNVNKTGGQSDKMLEITHNSLQNKQNPNFIFIKQKISSPPLHTNQKNTKKMFYNNKLSTQNDKNKLLIDLYLRKTKFQKIKSFISNEIKQQKLQMLNKNTDNNLNLSHVAKVINFSSTKQSNSIFQTPKMQSNPSIQTQKNLTIVAESPKSKFKKSKNFKSTRNLSSQNKFVVYLSSSKESWKVKTYASKTTQIEQSKNNLVAKQIISLQQPQVQVDLKMKVSQIKKLKKLNLRIRTQMPDSKSLLTIQKDGNQSFNSARQKQQTIRNKIGALKYKSPRVLLTSRNTAYQSRKYGAKLKLFTQEQQSSIIQQFYNDSKSRQKQ